MKSDGENTTKPNPEAIVPQGLRTKIGLGAGLAMGIGLGVALGILMKNLSVGIAIGVALGAGVGASLDEAEKRRSKPKD